MISNVNSQFDEARKQFKKTKTQGLKTFVGVQFNPRLNKLIDRYLTTDHPPTKNRIAKRIKSFRYRFYLIWQNR